MWKDKNNKLNERENKLKMTKAKNRYTMGHINPFSYPNKSKYF